MLILTGARGCGKTTFLKRAILDNNLAVQGFLSLKIVENGVAVGIKLLTLPERGEIFMGVSTPDRTKPLSTGHYAFEDDVFQRVDARSATLDPNLPFILDEFGRLEMRGLAHFDLFQKVKASGLKLLVVVRKDLLEAFLECHADPEQALVLDVASGDASLETRVRAYLASGVMRP